jgi:hypothetical protein
VGGRMDAQEPTDEQDVLYAGERMDAQEPADVQDVRYLRGRMVRAGMPEVEQCLEQLPNAKERRSPRRGTIGKWPSGPGFRI